MKKIQALFAAVFCGVVFSVAVSASAQTGDSGYATIVRVEGLVSYSLGNDKWYPLVAGKILPVGAVIRTGYNGVADMVLGKDINLPQTAVQGRWNPGIPSPDAGASKIIDMASYRPASEQNVVRLTPDTTLGINKLTIIDTGADTVSDTELDLKKGKIFASVKKLTGASQYLIKLPNGIAGVRGTKFSISVDGTTAVFDDKNHPSNGVVLSLIFSDGSTKTFVITPGHLLDPATGEPAVLSSDLVRILTAIFSALPTTFSPLEYCTRDLNQCYVSPVHGFDGGHHHHND